MVHRISSHYLLQLLMNLQSSQNKIFNSLSIYFWLCWVCAIMQRLSPVAAAEATLHCGARASRCGALSCCRARALGAWTSGVAASGSVVVAYRVSCFSACGIFLDKRANRCSLHWQGYSYPLYHLGSPRIKL